MTDGYPFSEAELKEVASAIDWPDGDVVAAARRRIEGGYERSPKTGRVWQLAVAAALILAVIVTVPSGRRAVARLLGVAGIEVTFGFDGHATTSEMGLGDVVTVEEVRHLTGRDLALPTALSPPDEIRIASGEVDIVHAVWGSGPDIPEIPGTDTGLLLTQFVSRADTTLFHKSLAESTTISLTSVAGEQGLWIEGAPHEVRYPTPGGEVTDVISRMAANVLMWEDDGMTFRLETSLGLDDARRIAASVAPVGAGLGG